MCLRRTSFFLSCVFFFNDPAPTEIYTLSLHDALPISTLIKVLAGVHTPDEGRISWNGTDIELSHPQAAMDLGIATIYQERSEEHTSELQSPVHLVCRLLLEKKKKKQKYKTQPHNNTTT